MRLIDADALKEEIRQTKFSTRDIGILLELIDNAPAVETMNPDYQIKVNIPEEETQKLIEELQRCRPCILPEFKFTDDDIQELIKENFNIGYEMAKNKYSRPRGEWIVTAEDNDGVHRICCPFCSYEKGSNNTDHIIVTFIDFPNFCERCGADMRKGGAE